MWPSARTKAKTPLIVHNQGKSRQTPNSRSAPVPGAATSEPAGRLALPKASASSRPEIRNPESVHASAQSRQKTPVIVHNQGKSRQTPFFQTGLHPANPPAGWGGPAVERSEREPRKIPLLQERIQVRASVTTNLPLCVKNLPSRHVQGSIKAENPSNRA